jgi:TolB-like protein
VIVLALGFLPALIISWAYELTPEGLKREKDVVRDASITRITAKRMDGITIGLIVVALAFIMADRMWLSPKFAVQPAPTTDTEVVTDNVQSSESEPQYPLNSIAVLPFVNMSSDAEQEYFSDGISEEILNALAKVKGLQVTGRTSSFAFKGQDQDLRVIGKALAVNHILEGSVRKSGNTVRITAQLIQVDNGFHLWSEVYDRELNDVFAIQDEIANNILQQLKATLLGEETTVVTAARTDSQAYELYLLAKQRMYQRTGPTIEAAAELLDRAIAIDPDYAPAYAQRGIANLLLAKGNYGNIPREQARSQAKLYLDKALALDPMLAEAWAVLGLYYAGQPSGMIRAIELLQKALAINPGMLDASNWLSNILLGMGRPVEAYDIRMGMIARDPLYRPNINNAVRDFIDFGQQEQAFAFLDRIRPLIPNNARIQSSEAAILLSLGQVAEGLALIESSVALQPSNGVARHTRRFVWMASHQYERVAAEDGSELQVYALAFLGRNEEASIRAFKRADERTDVGTLFNYLNITGRSDELIAYLEERWPNLDALRVDSPPNRAIGYDLMLDVALAYSRAGNQQRFDDALEHVRTVHENLKTQGVKSSIFFMNEAAHQALAGDIEASLDYLTRAISQGLITTAKITQRWPALSPLEGDPRFQAIQASMIEHLNSERQKLGLDPVST